MICISCHFIPLIPLTLRMDHAKFLDVLTSLPVSHALLPRVVCFATPGPANHAIWCFIDSVDKHLGQSEYVYFYRLYNNIQFFFYFNFGRHKDLSTRKVNITFKGRYM